MSGHFHAFGDAVLDGYRPSKKRPNSACRCEQHIAPKLKDSRAVRTCAYECWICQQARVLAARLQEQH